MTRTPPEIRRRLTGGALRPREGILRHTLEEGNTPCKASLSQDVWPELSKNFAPLSYMRTPMTRSYSRGNREFNLGAKDIDLQVLIFGFAK